MFEDKDKAALMLANLCMRMQENPETGDLIAWTDEYADPTNQFDLFYRLATAVVERFSAFENNERTLIAVTVTLIETLAELEMIDMKQRGQPDES